MVRIIAILAAVTAVAFTLTASPPEQQEHDDSLSQKRIELLEQRVAAIRKWVDQERMSVTALLRPEMDVINARLDYVETDAERKELLGELLAKYDQLVEFAEFNVQEPVRPGQPIARNVMMAETDLFLLKSERVRVQILHDALE